LLYFTESKGSLRAHERPPLVTILRRNCWGPSAWIST